MAITCGVALAAPPEPVEEPVMPTQVEPRPTNQLIHATSPYLLQHAHNPVNWFEWGDESLKKARDEDKPIFLSIGYSACHWCHVMEHECFEDEGIARLLNESFVSIKVDREERPDIDEIYMQATMRMTGHGGWPMSVFITPDGKPFFTGTYFPRAQFELVLTQIADLWRIDRSQILESGTQMAAYLSEWAGRARAGTESIGVEVVDRTAQLLADHFDYTDGGLTSGGNKFPPSMAMELMLRVHRRRPEQRLIDAVKVTLTKMARGGIYDHLGGGICRYSTDPQWLVPHFEKMLYDQALVGAIYVDAFQATGEPLFRDTARGIFDYVLRDLQSPEGGFHSTRDADSEGMEGKYYIWTVDQVVEVLGAEDAALFCSYYDVTESGNWVESRGHAPPGPKNILNIQRDVETVARLNATDPQELGRRLEAMRGRMLAAREKRIPPGLDDKILTEWNGLMIAALAKGAQAFDEPRYADAATRAADFVLKNLRRDGRLLRSHRRGRSQLTAYATDYAFFVEGLLNLYEATFDPRWIGHAVTLTDDMIARFADEEHGGFFMTASDGEKLIVRTRDAGDGAIPSGNSVAAMNLLRLAILVDKPAYRARAESVFRAFSTQVARSPVQFERLLCAVDFHQAPIREIAVVGAADAPQTHAMLRVVHEGFRPNKVVAFAPDESSATASAGRLPLLRGKKPIDGKSTGYVCRGYVCAKPATTVAEFAAALNAGDGPRE